MKTPVIGGLVFAALSLLCTVPAQAWNCSTPGQIRVQVPNGTVGTGTGDGSGQVVVVGGLTFQCQNPPSTSSTSNANSNSSSNSKSTSQSNSNSSSNATGGNATGGSVNNSGNSTAIAAGGQGGTGGSVKDSGNSTNVNTNIAQGGQGGSVKNSGNSSINNSGNSKIENSGNSNQKQSQNQGQSQVATGGKSSANGNGDNSNNSSSVTNVPRDTATAIAPPVYPTVPCFKGIGIGAQGPAFGASFGGGKIDQNCAELEAARQAPTLIARCKILLTNKFYQKAGVSMEDCMAVPAPREVVVQAPVETPAPQIVVNVPPIIVPTPQISVSVEAPVPAKPLPPPVKQHHVVKPCPTVPPCQANLPGKLSSQMWTNDDLESLRPENK